MNWRPLIPCAGLCGGALTGWQFRSDAPDATALSTVNPPARLIGAADAGSVNFRQPGLTNLSELRDLWTNDGAVGIYELLDGVPAATLVAWLDELMPPETYSRSLEREKRDGIRNALVERLAERDPTALAAWLLRVPGGHVDGNWLGPCVRALLHQNTPDAVAVLDRLENAHGFSPLRLEWLAERDPEAALQQVLARPGMYLPPELARWLLNDPARALAFANERPDRCFSILSAVAARGRAALEQFAAGLTAPEAQRNARRLQLTAAAQDGDVTAVTGLLEQDGRNQNDSLQDVALATLARLHPEKAEAMMQQLADRPSLATPLFNELAQSHPERAAAILASEAAKPGYWSAMHTLSRTWSLADPAAAQAWLRDLPDELRAKAAPMARDITDDLPTAGWLALTRGLPIHWNHASNFSAQVLERTKDPAILAEWCASFPDTAREHLLHQLRERLNDQPAADDISRRVEAALSAETP